MKKILSISLLALMGLSSCQKDEVTYQLFNPSGVSIEDQTGFKITTNSAIVKANQPVNFTINGKKDELVFWSGETSREYINKNRKPANLESANMSFSSRNQYGGQANTLQVMFSKNFDGNFTAASIANATWVNLTSRATIPGQWVNTVTASGTVNLGDLFVSPADQGYIAFKFVSLDAAGGTKKTWTITNFNMNYKLPEKTATTLTLSDLAWTPVSVLPSAPTQKWAIAQTQLSIIGGVAGPATEDWVISRKLQFGENTPADTGVPVSLSANQTNYTHTFATPGKYRVTFEHKNNADTEYTVKEFVITVQ